MKKRIKNKSPRAFLEEKANLAVALHSSLIQPRYLAYNGKADPFYVIETLFREDIIAQSRDAEALLSRQEMTAKGAIQMIPDEIEFALLILTLFAGIYTGFVQAGR